MDGHETDVPIDIDFADIELYPRFLGGIFGGDGVAPTRGNNFPVDFELCCELQFTSVLPPLDLGDIEVQIELKAARLTLELTDCEMPLSQQNYRDLALEKASLVHARQSRSFAKLAASLRAKLGLSLGGPEAEVSAGHEREFETQLKAELVRHVVNRGVRGQGYPNYLIADPLGRPLTGTVIHKDDRENGVLGALTNRSPTAWQVKPMLEISLSIKRITERQGGALQVLKTNARHDIKQRRAMTQLQLVQRVLERKAVRQRPFDPCKASDHLREV